MKLHWQLEQGKEKNFYKFRGKMCFSMPTSIRGAPIIRYSSQKCWFCEDRKELELFQKKKKTTLAFWIQLQSIQTRPTLQWEVNQSHNLRNELPGTIALHCHQTQQPATSRDTPKGLTPLQRKGSINHIENQ